MVLKVNIADIYSAVQIDKQLAMKVDIASLHRKEKIDAQILEPDVADSTIRSKEHIHTEIGIKVDDAYTKQQTHSLMQQFRDQPAIAGTLNTYTAHGVPLGKVRIKSSTYNEYLYSKNCRGDGERRHVHTLIGGREPYKQGASQWEIEWIGPATFHIRNCAFEEYLYPKNNENDGKHRMVHTRIGGELPQLSNSSGHQSEWLIEVTTAGRFLIMSKMFREFLYAEYDKNDGIRRFVHTWIPSRSFNDECEWLIEPVIDDGFTW